MSAIKIYNSLTRKKEHFSPLNKGRVNMYVCGPTVYDKPHIGHARSAYIFDVIRKYLRYRQYAVTFVRNITDIDDKIIKKAKEEFGGEDLNSAVKAVADKYLKAYHKAMEVMGISPPDSEPQATAYIGKIIGFISRLITNGAAYDSGGDVYFDISKSAGYGRLSNQSLEMMRSGARVTPGENKRNALDFALWKKAKEGEPCWDSPWGKGRPGWHIECSVMSSDILGDEFDIHGGGIDLIFPHHENELAQSEGAGGKFARYWIHNGLLTINGQKMAKSLGNFVTIQEAVSKYSKNALKIFYLQAHYSNSVDFSEGRIRECKSALERLYVFFAKMERNKKHLSGQNVLNPRFKEIIDDFKSKFTAAMDDDFNTPQALSCIFEIVRTANVYSDDRKLGGEDIGFVIETAKELSGIFGLSFTRTEDISSPVRIKIKERNQAKQEGDFERADLIREELRREGVILEDTPQGTTWRRGG